jgi:hypothetical protein
MSHDLVRSTRQVSATGVFVYLESIGPLPLQVTAVFWSYCAGQTGEELSIVIALQPLPGVTVQRDYQTIGDE